MATLGLDEIFEREAVVLIEWGERFPELMPGSGSRCVCGRSVGIAAR